MASLLSWAEKKIKGGVQTVNRDVVQPVAQSVQRDVVQPFQHVAAPVVQAVQNAPQTFHNDVVQPVQRDVVKPAVGLGQSFASPFEYLAKTDLINPARQVAAQFSHNNVAAHNAQLATNRNLGLGDKGTNFSGGLRKFTANAAQIGLDVALPGAGKVIDKSFTSVAPKIIPKLIPKVLARAGTGAIAGGPFNAASYVASNQPLTKQGLTQSFKQGSQIGAVLGGAEPIVGHVAPIVTKGISNQLKSLSRSQRLGIVKTASSAKPTGNIQLSGLQKTDISGYGDLDPKQVEKYRQQLSSGGTVKPILAMRGEDGKTYVEDGKHRVAAATSLGMKTLPGKIVTPTDVKKISQGGYVSLPGRASEDAGNVPKDIATPSQSTDSVKMPSSISNRQVSSDTSIASNAAIPAPKPVTPATIGKALGLTDKQMAATTRENNPLEPTITNKDRTTANIVNNSATKVKNARLQGDTLPEDQTILNAHLKDLPPSSQYLPKLQQESGDLQPMQELPTSKRLFSSKVAAIRATNTPAGHQLADAIEKTDRDSTNMRAGWMHQIKTVQKLSDKDFQDAWDVQEGAKKLKDVSPAAQQGAQELKKVMPQIHQAGHAQGLLVGKRANYLPHHYDLQGIAKNKSKYDSMIQYLMDSGQIKHNEAVQVFKNMQTEAARYPNHFGHFENARLTDAPGYEKSKQTLYNYVQGAAQRTAEASNLGLDNQTANRLLTNLRQQGGDVDTASEAVANYLRTPGKNKGIIPTSLKTARGAFGAFRLSKAAISHAGQTGNTAVDTGVGNTIKTWGQYLTKNADDKDFIDRTGVVNPQTLHHYQDQYTSLKGVASRITAPGLNQTIKVNRSVTALAYRNFAQKLAEDGNETELRKLGVQGDIGNKLTDQQELEAARGGVQRTMFGGSRATTPIKAETPVGQTIGQYRTAYAYPQTRFAYERVLQEARHGNIAPLTRYLAISGGIGAGTVAIKNKISGSKEGPGGVVADTVGALGGLPGELAEQGVRYGAKDLVKTVAGDIAPLAGEAVDIGERATQALQGKPQQLERYGLGLVPLIGNRIAAHAVPYAAGSNKAQVEAGAKQPTAGIYKNAAGKYVTLQSSEYKSYKDLPSAQLAQAKNELKYSKNTSTTFNGQPYYKTASGTIEKGYNPATETPAQKYTVALSNYTTTQKNLSDAQKYSAQQNLAKLKVEVPYSSDVISLYGLSKAKLNDFLTTDQNGKALYSQLQAYDQDLLNAGLITTPKFKYGLSTASSSSSGGSAANAFLANLKYEDAIKAPTLPKLAKPKAPTKIKQTAFKKFTPKKIAISKSSSVRTRKGIV